MSTSPITLKSTGDDLSRSAHSDAVRAFIASASPDEITNFCIDSNSVLKFVSCPRNLDIRTALINHKLGVVPVNIFPFNIFSDISDEWCQALLNSSSCRPVRSAVEARVIDFHSYIPKFSVEIKTPRFIADKSVEDSIVPTFERISLINIDLLDKEFNNKLIEFGCVIGGGFMLEHLCKLYSQPEDLDIFSFSLDFLRWFINRHKENIKSIDMCYFRGQMHSYKVVLTDGNFKFTINFIHVMNDLSVYGGIKIQGVTGIMENAMVSSVLLKYSKAEDAPPEFFPQDIRPKEGDQERLRDHLSKTFDLSCCCIFYDGVRTWYNEDTKARKADALCVPWRFKKYSMRNIDINHTPFASTIYMNKVGSCTKSGFVNYDEDGNVTDRITWDEMKARRAAAAEAATEAATEVTAE